MPFAAEAIAEAERSGDPVLLAEALGAELGVHWGPDGLAYRLRITARLEDTVVPRTRSSGSTLLAWLSSSARDPSPRPTRVQT